MSLSGLLGKINVKNLRWNNSEGETWLLMGKKRFQWVLKQIGSQKSIGTWLPRIFDMNSWTDKRSHEEPSARISVQTDSVGQSKSCSLRAEFEILPTGTTCLFQ
jgi:hypothetical protein